MKHQKTSRRLESNNSKDSKKELFSKGKEFLEMYNKVTNFTEELLHENELLKKRVEELRVRQKKSKEEVLGPSDLEIQKKIEKLKEERQFLLEQYRQKEEETQDFMGRYQEIEMENNNLANLYVASYQLHSTLDIQEVLDIVIEIIINLIGAQTFGILLFHERQNLFRPVKAEGVELSALPTMAIGEGIIGSVAEAGEIYYREQAPDTEEIDVSHPMVCVPMKIKDRLIGVIVVYKLLQQKEQLTKVDYELFTLLAGHAATAVFSARLYTDSIRKRKTIKGFLDLVTR
jgi:hypothetical protein